MKTPHSINVLFLCGTVCVSLALNAPSIAGKWKNKAASPTAQLDSAVVAIDGLLYVAGGLTGQANSTLLAFNPSKNKWSTLADIPGPRYLSEAATINGQLYVVGGLSNFLPRMLNTNFWVYDPPTNTWNTSVTQLSHLSAGGIAGAINGKLYVTTPENGSNINSTYLDVYDPVANTWNSLPSSSVVHDGGAGGVINGKLYVAGGVNDTGVGDALEVYDPNANTWTTLATMPIGVQTAASAVINGKLYVFGGFNGTTAINTVQVYDPVKNTWAEMTPVVPITASQFNADVLDGIAFLIGGVDNGGSILSSNYLFLEAPSIP
jgi:N-acetylneuraminic acid mutarotase